MDDVDDLTVRVLDFRPLPPVAVRAPPTPNPQDPRDPRDAEEGDDAFYAPELIFDLEL